MQNVSQFLYVFYSKSIILYRLSNCATGDRGRSGSKNPCWVYLKDLNEGKQRLFMYFEVRDFGRIYYKKRTKFKFWDTLCQKYQHLKFLSKLAEICTRWPQHRGTKLIEIFWKFEHWQFCATFARKMTLI